MSTSANLAGQSFGLLKIVLYFFREAVTLNKLAPGWFTTGGQLSEVIDALGSEFDEDNRTSRQNQRKSQKIAASCTANGRRYCVETGRNPLKRLFRALATTSTPVVNGSLTWVDLT